MVAAPEALLPAIITPDWNRPRAHDWADVLARLPLFARVSKRQLRRVAALAEVREFGSGDVVVQRRAAPDGFHLILGGRARVAGSPEARVLETGDYFGEMALLDGERRSATVVAVGELQTMRLPRRAFVRLLKQDPEIAIAMLTELARRVRRLEAAAA